MESYPFPFGRLRQACTSLLVPWNEGRVGRGGVRETGKDMRGR